MKIINILLMSLLLVSCNDSRTSSSILYKGNWENIFAKTLATTDGAVVNPFNTSMYLKYFIDESLENKDDFISKITGVYQERINDLHKKFDRHHSYYVDLNEHNKGRIKNIKTVNESLDSGEFIELDEETYNLLKISVEYTKYSEGYFNIFVGELTDFWDEIFKDWTKDPYLYNIDPDNLDSKENERRLREDILPLIPTIDEIDEILEFNDETKSVRFNSLKDESGKSKGKISISVGGIAKGYATELVKQEFIKQNYTQGYLFSGGSSISSLDKPIYNNSKGQNLSIVDPRTAGSLFDKKEAVSVYLKESFNMSTSGNYIGGKSFYYKINETGEYITRHHIINPYTGYPEDKGVASVSVFSEKLGADILDAFSTTLVNKSIEDGLKFREKVMNDVSLGNPDLEIIYILENLKDNTIEIQSTSNFNNTITIADSEGITFKYVK